MLSIGLDLDGCIDEAPDFFSTLSEFWPAKVYIITFRRDYEKPKGYVEQFNINYEEIILVNRFEDKAVVIKEKEITVYFDDQDEILMHIPENVVVFKIRNGGNFDYESKRWLYSNATGRQI